MVSANEELLKIVFNINEFFEYEAVKLENDTIIAIDKISNKQKKFIINKEIMNDLTSFFSPPSLKKRIQELFVSELFGVR